MFEHWSKPLLPRIRFVRRMALFLLVGAAIDFLVVSLGALGFRLVNDLPWVDAVVDAAMLVTGNGPRHPVVTLAGKWFLATYALVGCTAFVVVIALILAPALHRLAHSFHLRGPDEA
jgi:hypothetical protein